MKFNPRNRHVLVELVEETKEDKSTILVPDDYKPKEYGYGLAQILRIAPDCKQDFNNEDLIIIDKHMLIEIEINNIVFHLILENHIFGVMPNKERS